MATLSKTDQLATANKEFVTWRNQVAAETGYYPNGAERDAKMNQILASGQYPDLTFGRITTQETSGNAVTVGFNQFFIVGDGGYVSSSNAVNPVQAPASATNTGSEIVSTTSTTTTSNATADTATDSNQGQTLAGTSSAAGTNAVVSTQNTDNTVINNSTTTNSNTAKAEDGTAGAVKTAGTATTSAASLFSGTSSAATVSDAAKQNTAVNTGATGSATTTGAGTAASGSNTTTATGGAKPNKLHDYSNTTYRISLFMIPPSTLNQVYDGSLSDASSIIKDGIFVCSDAGLGSEKRSSYFPVDLTIDQLQLDTIVGTTNRTRGTDVISMDFNIIEPYTVTFLSRLQVAAKKINPANAGWEITFFVMRIEFFGYNDKGYPQIIPNTTKYIPFTMVNMSFKITSSGAIYSCKAIPTSAMAQTVLDNTIPFHVEVQANTIKDLFTAEDVVYKPPTTSDSARADDGSPAGNTAGTNATTSTGNQTVIKGLDKALNNAEKEKVAQKTGQTKPNEYKFTIDPAISAATIVDPAEFQTNSIAPVSGKDTKSQVDGKTGALTLDLKNHCFRAQAGTKITDFINSVISVSTYTTKQYSAAGANKGNALNWWKINPVVKWGDVDPGTNYYQRTVNFVVTANIILGCDHPGFPQKPPTANDCVKQYNYIYSGDNKDIISAEIDYKMAFFQLKNGVPANYTKRAEDSPGQVPTAQENVVAYDGSQDKRNYRPKYHYVRGVANRQNTGATTATPKAIAVSDLMEQLYDNEGDMIKLDITIVGDPDWISQDVPLFGPAVGNSNFIGNGSVNFTRQAYFGFYFATPVSDYDDKSGMFNQTGAYSTFSGIYNVIRVKSSFSGGKFTQQLENYRTRTQQPASQGPAREAPSTANRTAELAKQSAKTAAAATKITPASTKQGTSAEDAATTIKTQIP